MATYSALVAQQSTHAQWHWMITAPGTITAWGINDLPPIFKKKEVLSMVTIVEFEERDESLDSQIPIAQPKWLKRAIVEDEEEIENEKLVEAGVLQAVDPYSEWTIQEERLLLEQEGYGIIEEDERDYDWPKAPKNIKEGMLIVEAVEPLFISDLEPSNPYYAGPYPHFTNPNRKQLTEDINLVQRRFTDNISKYMGSPSYSDNKDKLIYVDIHGYIDKQRATIRVMANKWNQVRERCAIIIGANKTVKAMPIYSKGGSLWISMFGDVKYMAEQIDEIAKPTVTYSDYKVQVDIDMICIEGASVEQSVLEFTDVSFDTTRGRAQERAYHRNISILSRRIERYIRQQEILVAQHAKGMHSEAFFNKQMETWKKRIIKVKEQLGV